MVNFYNEDIDFPFIEKEKVRKWISKIILQSDKKGGELSFIFCSDNYLLEINREYLKHDYFTDIITFNYNEENKISGDIFISLDTVKVNANKFKVSFNNELHRVIIHGILHLIGFDDKNDEQKAEMRKKEDEALNILTT